MGKIVESKIQSGTGFDVLLPGPEPFERPFDLPLVSLAQFALDASGRGKSGRSAHIDARLLVSIACFRFGADRQAAAQSEDESKNEDEASDENWSHDLNP